MHSALFENINYRIVDRRAYYVHSIEHVEHVAHISDILPLPTVHVKLVDFCVESVLHRGHRLRPLVPPTFTATAVRHPVGNDGRDACRHAKPLEHRQPSGCRVTQSLENGPASRCRPAQSLENGPFPGKGRRTMV